MSLHPGTRYACGFHGTVPGALRRMAVAVKVSATPGPYAILVSLSMATVTGRKSSALIPCVHVKHARPAMRKASRHLLLCIQGAA